MPRFYLDEDVKLPVAYLLRADGHEVVTTKERLRGHAQVPSGLSTPENVDQEIETARRRARGNSANVWGWRRTSMAASPRQSLDYYLSLEYPFNVIPDPDGGYVITFPDLPGCLAQVERYEQITEIVGDVRTIWLKTAYEQGLDIPLPSSHEEYSGRFNVRLPRSLHRQLAEVARRENVSLNQCVVMLLSRGVVEDRSSRRRPRRRPPATPAPA